MRGKRFNLGISLLVALLVVSIAFMGGCAKTPPIPPTIQVEPVGYSDVCIPIGEFRNHPHIDVVMHGRAGGGLTVALGSNPTTGFQWSELAEISDESIIQQVSHKFVGPGIDKPPGTPGEEVWIFKALKRGTTTTFLEYSRPWVEEDALHWTVTITTTIK